MKAVFYERTGPAADVLQFGTLPDPLPRKGEVRVRMRYSGVNPSDVKSRAGLRNKQLPFDRIVPHSDGMGVIDAVGEGVPQDRMGQRVWTWNAAWGRPFGTAAQFVVLPQEQAVPLPANVSDTAGACLGIPALTALHAMLAGGGVHGKTVLVAGGAGAVGHYAVQFARLLGAASVIATVSSDAKAQLAHEAGADVVINYKQENALQRIREATRDLGVDRIVEVDLAANLALDIEALRPGGKCLVYGSSAAEIAVPFFPMLVKNVLLRFFIVYNLDAAERQAALETLDGLLQRGVQHNVAQVLPLARAAQAHELVESGKLIGNLVLEVPQ